MTKLAKKINKEPQPYRAIYDYLSKTEVSIDLEKTSNNPWPFDKIHNPFDFYDMVIQAAEYLKTVPRDHLGRQTEYGDPDITLPSNN